MAAEARRVSPDDGDPVLVSPAVVGRWQDDLRVAVSRGLERVTSSGGSTSRRSAERRSCPFGHGRTAARRAGPAPRRAIVRGRSQLYFARRTAASSTDELPSGRSSAATSAAAPDETTGLRAAQPAHRPASSAPHPARDLSPDGRTLVYATRCARADGLAPARPRHRCRSLARVSDRARPGRWRRRLRDLCRATISRADSRSLYPERRRPHRADRSRHRHADDRCRSRRTST